MNTSAVDRINHHSFEWSTSSPNNELDCLNSDTLEGERFPKLINRRVTFHFTGQCPASWDNVLCWPPTDPGQLITIPCSTALRVMGVPAPSEISNSSMFVSRIPFPIKFVTKFCLTCERITDATAFRICSNSGDWVWGNWTNYTQCMSALEPVSIPDFPDSM